MRPSCSKLTEAGSVRPLEPKDPRSGTKKCIGALFEGNGKAQKTEADMQAYVKRPEMTLGSVAVHGGSHGMQKWLPLFGSAHADLLLLS